MTGTLELLENVLNSMRLGIVVIDRNDRIVFFNCEAGKMLNEEPKERIGQSTRKRLKKTFANSLMIFEKTPAQISAQNA